MVLLLDGTPLSEIPATLGQLYSQHPRLRDRVGKLVGTDRDRSKDVGPMGSLYVTQREFAITHPQDSKVDILGTDSLVNNVALVLRNPASGSTLVSQVDRLTTTDLDTMVGAVLGSQTYGNSGLHISLVGAFQDSKNVSQSLLLPVLSTLHCHSQYLEMDTVCVGEMATGVRNGVSMPLICGIGVNVKTGEMFPARFPDKGPDMDLRTARTLCSGDSEDKLPGMLDVYNMNREELIIGPFTYSPMRAVDIWLQQTDQFLLQSLSPCPEAVEDPDSFIKRLKSSLSLVKAHPYPSVTLFQSNSPRSYTKNSSGHWISTSCKSTAAVVNPHWYMASQTQQIKSEYNISPSYKMDQAVHFAVKHEAMPWNMGNSLHPMAYY